MLGNDVEIVADCALNACDATGNPTDDEVIVTQKRNETY